MYCCPHCGKAVIISIQAEVKLKKKETDSTMKPFMEDYMLDFIPELTHMRIQEYLVKINSWLKNRITRVTQEDKTILERPFSKFMFDLCEQYKISQIYVLALIQKEQSALFRETPPKDSVQAKIVGYAITESGKIPGYDGFEMQFKSAIKQLSKYDTWSQVKNLETVQLCDDAEDRQCLKEMGVEFTGRYKPINKCEAKSALYTPRLYPLIQMGQLYNKIKAEI